MSNISEQLLCECDCGGTPNQGNRFINGHNRRGKLSWLNGLTKETDDRIRRIGERTSIRLTGKKQSEETKLKRNKKLKGQERIQREFKKCLSPGCPVIFKCKVTSKKKYCCNWHAVKGTKRTFTEEHIKKLKEKRNNRLKEVTLRQSASLIKNAKINMNYGMKGKKHKKETIEKIINSNGYKNRILWHDIRYDKNKKDKIISKILSKVNLHPNNFEQRCGEQLEKQFPGKFKYVGNGSVIINGKSPDFISEELQVVVLCNGIYWHLFRQGLTLNDKKIVELKESEPFIKVGYEVWFIWENYIREKNVIFNKCVQFRS